MFRPVKSIICGFCLIFIAQIGCAQSLKINELMARNANGLVDEFGDDDDWIEIYNPSSSAINLAGLYISDTNSVSNFYRIPGSDASRTTVPAGGYLVLWADGEPAEGPNHLAMKLNNGGEGVFLGQLSGGTITMIDMIEFPKLERDVSYGRLPDGTGDFKLLSDPSPGSSNLPIRVLGNIIMNELAAINNGADRDESNEAEDWIEFYNPGSQAIDLGGAYLTDSVGELTMHRIPITSPDSTTVPAGGFLRFWADAEPRTSILHLDFKLRGNGEKITFVQPDGHTIIQQVRYPAQNSDASFGQLPDGSNNWVYLNIPSPNYPNQHTYTEVDGILINEIMADNESIYPDNVGEIEDWIEFYNTNDFPVNLGGLLVTDSLENPMAYRIPNTFPDSTTIPAKGFLVFWADNDPEQGVLHLDIKLSGKGEDIGLFQLRQDLYELDSHIFGQQSSNITIGRTPDGSENWVILDNPTPNSANTGGESGIISGIYINEIMARNTLGYQDEHGNIDDWIELYNNTDKDVDLGGLYLTDNYSDLLKSIIPENDPTATTIPAKGYLVLWADAKPELGTLHMDFQLAGSGEKVRLTQILENELIVVDSVTYPSQSSNISYGRSPDAGKSWSFFSNPTPNASNPGNSLNDHSLALEYQTRVFPNPFKEELSLAFILNEPSDVIWKIFDIKGQEICSGYYSGSSGENTVNLGKYASEKLNKPGMYFIRLSIGGDIIHQRIQKL